MTKRFPYSIVLAVLVLGLCQTTFAQTVKSYMRPHGSLKDTAKGTFSSVEGGYDIALPSSIGGRNNKTFTWRLTEGFFHVGYTDVEQDSEETKSLELARNALNAIFRDFLERMPEAQPTHKPIVLSDYAGVEMRLEMPHGLALARTFGVGKRFYSVAALLVGEQRKHEADAWRVFDSLKVKSGAEIAATLQRLFEEAKPASLPQTPVAKKLKSDAEDAGLKGKVKSVVTEREQIDRGKPGRKRWSAETIYDETGQRLQEVAYDDDGKPITITVYGYIAGSRVTRIGSVEYGNELVGGIPLPQGPRKPDERYDFRHVYRYDAKGNLSEYLFYNNSGVLLNRSVYLHKGNQLTENRYSEGRIIERLISRLDDKGNAIEMQRVSVPSESEPDKYGYDNYEFDAQGNWIKRRTSTVSEFEGQRYTAPAFIEYRTIVFYP